MREREHSGRSETMKLRRYVPASIALAVLLFLSSHTFAQGGVSFAQLNGTVQDTSGRALVRAAILLRELGTNQSYTASTNVTGYYVAPNLPPGKYELTVEFSGFAKYTQTGFVLTVGQTATIDITLKVASLGETVVVTGEAPPVEPTKSEISQVIDTVQIQGLPTNGRQFVDFALLTPGVATGRTSIQSTFTEPEVTRISFGSSMWLPSPVPMTFMVRLTDTSATKTPIPNLF